MFTPAIIFWQIIYEVLERVSTSISASADFCHHFQKELDSDIRTVLLISVDYTEDARER
jgi:hypothetical protein